MRTIKKTLPQLETTYFPDEFPSINEVAFIDIETTGFTARLSQLYLIGCIVYENDNFVLYQWFLDSKDDEPEVLNDFAKFITPYKMLVHFNGNQFDIPYLNDKFEQNNIDFSLSEYKGLDLYRRIAPYKNFLKLPDCKQKTIETYLGIIREDLFTGKELIDIYHDYTANHDEESLKLLLLHNEEDIMGMVQILKILSYVDLLNKPITVTKVQANTYNDIDGNTKQELIMKLKLSTNLPIHLSNHANGCVFSGINDTATLKVPIVREELKYFYSNYKDYYYLPTEDVALHKSVAAFVDSAHRKQATAATCYTRKISEYLPQWDFIVEPFFKREYRAKEYFFEVTEQIKQDRALFSAYASHILKMIFEST